MKRYLAFLLCLVLILGLCACNTSEKGSEAAAPEAGLKAGYAKINITPSYTVSLSGYGDEAIRTSDQGNIIDFLYATCIAVNSGDNTILIYTIDNLSIPLNFQKEYRANIAIATGLPQENIFFGATHSHSAPLMSGQYTGDLMNWLMEAAQKAIEDLAPATLSACRTNYEGMTFVRHYKNDDDTYVGSNFGNWGNLVGHAAEPDTIGALVKFDREGEKKDILMVNWQAHMDRGTELGRYNLAPSWAGPLRNKLEELTGLQVAYFTGDSGNLNADSKIASEAHNLDWRAYGEKLAELMAADLGNLQPVAGTEIKTDRQIVDVLVNHQWDSKLIQAKEVIALWESTQDATAANTLARSYDISSRHHASAIRYLAGKGLNDQLEANAFCIGELGFITGTYEMFSTSGTYIKENSPFDITFIITGNCYYLPTREAYEVYRCYESDTSHFAVGSAETMDAKFVEMLNGLK